MGLTPSLPCEKLYPLFLMYDLEGNLGAFGWVFQGRPNNFNVEKSVGWFRLTPNTYPVSLWYDISNRNTVNIIWKLLHLFRRELLMTRHTVSSMRIPYQDIPYHWNSLPSKIITTCTYKRLKYHIYLFYLIWIVLLHWNNNLIIID